MTGPIIRKHEPSFSPLVLTFYHLIHYIVEPVMYGPHPIDFALNGCGIKKLVLFFFCLIQWKKKKEGSIFISRQPSSPNYCASYNCYEFVGNDE